MFVLIKDDVVQAYLHDNHLKMASYEGRNMS
jgi:hypothetical protein